MVMSSSSPISNASSIAHQEIRGRRRGRLKKGAFTLIELLMVVVIILLATTMAIPSFVRSYKGAKLRSSVRTIVMASRYARSVAVLQQKQTAILFDTPPASTVAASTAHVIVFVLVATCT